MDQYPQGQNIQQNLGSVFTEHGQVQYHNAGFVWPHNGYGPQRLNDINKKFIGMDINQQSGRWQQTEPDLDNLQANTERSNQQNTLENLNKIEQNVNVPPFIINQAVITNSGSQDQFQNQQQSPFQTVNISTKMEDLIQQFQKKVEQNQPNFKPYVPLKQDDQQPLGKSKIRYQNFSEKQRQRELERQINEIRITEAAQIKQEQYQKQQQLKQEQQKQESQSLLQYQVGSQINQDELPKTAQEQQELNNQSQILIESQYRFEKFMQKQVYDQNANNISLLAQNNPHSNLQNQGGNQQQIESKIEINLAQCESINLSQDVDLPQQKEIIQQQQICNDSTNGIQNQMVNTEMFLKEQHPSHFEMQPQQNDNTNQMELKFNQMDHQENNGFNVLESEQGQKKNQTQNEQNMMRDQIIQQNLTSNSLDSINKLYLLQQQSQDMMIIDQSNKEIFNTKNVQYQINTNLNQNNKLFPNPQQNQVYLNQQHEQQQMIKKDQNQQNQIEIKLAQSVLREDSSNQQNQPQNINQSLQQSEKIEELKLEDAQFLDEDRKPVFKVDITKLGGPYFYNPDYKFKKKKPQQQGESKVAEIQNQVIEEESRPLFRNKCRTKKSKQTNGEYKSIEQLYQEFISEVNNQDYIENDVEEEAEQLCGQLEKASLQQNQQQCQRVQIQNNKQNIEFTTFEQDRAQRQFKTLRHQLEDLGPEEFMKFMEEKRKDLKKKQMFNKDLTDAQKKIWAAEGFVGHLKPVPDFQLKQLYEETEENLIDPNDPLGYFGQFIPSIQDQIKFKLLPAPLVGNPMTQGQLQVVGAFLQQPPQQFSEFDLIENDKVPGQFSQQLQREDAILKNEEFQLFGYEIQRQFQPYQDYLTPTQVISLLDPSFNLEELNENEQYYQNPEQFSMGMFQQIGPNPFMMQQYNHIYPQNTQQDHFYQNSMNPQIFQPNNLFQNNYPNTNNTNYYQNNTNYQQNNPNNLFSNPIANSFGNSSFMQQQNTSYMPRTFKEATSPMRNSATRRFDNQQPTNQTDPYRSQQGQSGYNLSFQKDQSVTSPANLYNQQAKTIYDTAPPKADNLTQRNVRSLRSNLLR